MHTALQDQSEQEPPVDLTLREAAELYDVTVKTLALHLRCGSLSGQKSRGAGGRQWRVTASALDAAGFRRRSERPSSGAPSGDGGAEREVLRLRQELAVAKHAAAADRRRADDLDRRLGHAQLECGRLRTALTAAGGGEQPTDELLDAASARWLITAITNGSTGQPDGRTPNRPARH